MGPWLLLLVLALIAAILGFATAAHWLFIVAVMLLVAGCHARRRAAGRGSSSTLSLRPVRRRALRRAGLLLPRPGSRAGPRRGLGPSSRARSLAEQRIPARRPGRSRSTSTCRCRSAAPPAGRGPVRQRTVGPNSGTARSAGSSATRPYAVRLWCETPR